MLRGLYTAASGLLADQAWQQAVGNNLDNANTPGYKADRTVIGEFGAVLVTRLGAGGVGVVGEGAAVASSTPDLASGPIDPTGRALDVAPVGGAWLAVRTPQGVRYTQDGALAVNAAGLLVGAQGYPVVGAGGAPIRVPAGAAASIGADGTVYADGRPVGRLLLTAFARPALLSAQGDGLFQAPAGAGARPFAPGTAVVPGALEGSNVNESLLTSQLVQVQAAFQADQESVRTDTATFGQLLQNLGK
ncbi:MAG: flagellar hook basal-body protein [Firmicutes bacterium]|nr:flagellar hook basal-body protein [Bacillota bacterium]